LRKLAPHAAAVFLPVLAYLLFRYSGWLGGMPLHAGREVAALLVTSALATGAVFTGEYLIKGRSHAEGSFAYGDGVDELLNR